MSDDPRRMSSEEFWRTLPSKWEEVWARFEAEKKNAAEAIATITRDIARGAVKCVKRENGE